MVEQEFYKMVLKRIIDETERNNYKSPHEVIQKLVYELSNNLANHKEEAKS